MCQTPLQTIFVYDIATQKWLTQNTTDTNGQTTNVYGSYTINDPGIPSDRYNMCAVVGTSSDHTEFNIYLFGGQNDTATPGDIWALTLPGAMWIRMTSTDTSNLPKTGSSCSLVHDRYVILADGCWMNGQDKCDSYGWNPLVYSIASIDYGNADWSWTYDPGIVGYNVPQQIFDVLGWSAR